MSINNDFCIIIPFWPGGYLYAELNKGFVIDCNCSEFVNKLFIQTRHVISPYHIKIKVQHPNVF